ncbi:MAG: hypothetical protein P1U88_13660 [Thalassobaculaceae bacterium]|nr:hypothetical protein [Thalassobaculaceae bacterium]
MPFDAQPFVDAELSGYMAPSEAALMTPVGTVCEPVLATIIDRLGKLINSIPESRR